MKIATWNVNSLTARLAHVLDWLAAHPVDVLCLQELKMTDDKFPHEALAAAGYPYCEAFGQKTYNGVAVISRHRLRDVVRNLPHFPDDSARVLTVSVEPDGAAPLRLINGYFVNGQAPGSEKFAYKMAWLQGLRRHVADEFSRHQRLVLLGDFNIAPEDRDSYDPEGLRGTIHHTPEERSHFRDLLSLGLVDAYRLFDQPDKSFSWWDYRMLGFQKNRGLRIDHILVSQAVQPLVRSCSIDRAPRKWPQPSDHAPVTLEIAGSGE